MPRKEQYSIGELTVDRITGGASLDMFSKRIFLDPVNGSDGNTGKSINHAKKTFAAAEDLLTANKNEALIWVPGSSYVGLTAGITWDKAFTHFIGLGASLAYGGRCRMYDTAAFAAPIFTVAAIGCMFKNIHWQRDFDSATGVENVNVGSSATNGSYNYFEDCLIDGPIKSALGAAAYRNLTLYDGARSNTFRRCTIGAWNQLATSTTGYQLYANGSTGYGFSGTHFDDCTVLWYGNSASITPLFCDTVGDTNCYILFDKCKFLGVGTSVNSLLAADPAAGSIIFSNCTSMGMAEYIAGSASHVFVTAAAAANAANGIASSTFS